MQTAISPTAQTALIPHRVIREVKYMPLCNCNCRCSCTAAALIVSAILGVLAAFLQITGVITVTTAFLWVALGIAVVYLGVQVLAAALAGCTERNICRCSALNALLAGLLGTALLALILLAVGIVATSVVSAILVGLLVFFLFLGLISTACYVRTLAGCDG